MGFLLKFGEYLQNIDQKTERFKKAKIAGHAFRKSLLFAHSTEPFYSFERREDTSEFIKNAKKRLQDVQNTLDSINPEHFSKKSYLFGRKAGRLR